MLLFKDKINYKLPSGNGFAAHLDAPAYDHIGKIEHLTANFAVDKATIENGCIEVVPGSHVITGSPQCVISC
jgi:2-aminoethylphosphonate dioxygenase